MKISLEDALGRLEEARFADVDEQTANALFQVGAAYLQRGRADEASEALDEAHYLCNKLENPLGAAQVCLRLAEARQAQGRVEDALERLDEAMAVFEEQGHVGGRLSALEIRGRLLARVGRSEQAARALEEGLETASRAGDKLGMLLMHQELAKLYRTLDRPERSREHYRDLGRLADELGDRRRTALALVGMGYAEAALGRPGRALGALGQARDEYQGLGQTKLAAQVEAEMGRLVGGFADNKHDEEES